MLRHHRRAPVPSNVSELFGSLRKMLQFKSIFHVLSSFLRFSFLCRSCCWWEKLTKNQIKFVFIVEVFGFFVELESFKRQLL